MSSSPLVIRQTPFAFHHHHHQQKPLTPPISPSSLGGSGGGELSSTPGDKHMFGSTPGGTRIVYSREQLLTLASSPLSAQHQSSFQLPNEISRSPDKDDLNNGGFKTVQYSNNNKNDASGRRRHQHQQPSPNRAKGISPNRATHRLPNVPAPLTFNHGIVNGVSPQQSRENGFGRSPHSATSNGGPLSGKPRSPGSAFNFAKGPVSSGGGNPSSFKERLEAASAAAAKQQKLDRGQGEEEESVNEDTFEIEL